MPQYVNTIFKKLKTFGTSALSKSVNSSVGSELRLTLGKYAAMLVAQNASNAEIVSALMDALTSIDYDYPFGVAREDITRTFVNGSYQVFDRIWAMINESGSIREVPQDEFFPEHPGIDFTITDGRLYRLEGHMYPQDNFTHRVLVLMDPSGREQTFAWRNITTQETTFCPIFNEFSFGQSILTLGDITNALVTSLTLNQALEKASMLLSGPNLSEAIGLFKDWVSHAGQTIKVVQSFISDLAEGFSSNGFIGAAQVIIRYIEAGASMTTDDSGCFTFTDNSSLVPQDFVAGFVDVATMVASTAANIVAAAFKGIIGALAGVVSAGFSFITKALGNLDATRASLNLGSAVTMPISPIGTVKVKNIRLDDSSELVGIISTYGVANVEVPGGLVLIGIDPSSVGGPYLTYMAEFHPDLQDRRLAAFHICDSIYTHSTIGTSDLLSQTDPSLTRKGLAQIIASALVEYPTQPWTMTPDMDGVLDAEDDKTLRGIIAANLCIGCFYLGLMHSGSSVNYWAETVSLPNCVISTSDMQWHVMWNYAGYPKDYWLSSGIFVAQWVAVSDPTSQPPKWEDFFNYSDGLGHPFSLDYLLTAGSLFFDAEYHPLGQGTYAAFLDELGIMLRGDAGVVTGQYQYAHTMPHFTETSFWLSTVIGVAVAVAIASVAVVTTLKVKKFLTVRRAQNAAKVEAAWTNLTKNPTVENAAIYRKQAKKANFLSKIVGGTVFDTSNYWTGGNDDESSGDTPIPVAAQVLSDLYRTDATDGTYTIEGIYQLIRG